MNSATARLGLLIILFWAAAASAQTPAPFAYWQNAAGIVLAPLGGPIPDWRATVGGGVAAMPLYEGADHYKLEPAPAFDIRYSDIAFLSSGDGLELISSAARPTVPASPSDTIPAATRT